MKRMHTKEEIQSDAVEALSDIGIEEDENGIAVEGNIAASGEITGDAIIENMEGYSATIGASDWTCKYCGVVKNGNKLTFAGAGTIQRTASTANTMLLVEYTIPQEIADKLIPLASTNLSVDSLACISGATVVNITTYTQKQNPTGNKIRVFMHPTSTLSTSLEYFFRYEVTFLLSESLI